MAYPQKYAAESADVIPEFVDLADRSLDWQDAIFALPQAMLQASVLSPQQFHPIDKTMSRRPKSIPYADENQ